MIIGGKGLGPWGSGPIYPAGLGKSSHSSSAMDPVLDLRSQSLSSYPRSDPFLGWPWSFLNLRIAYAKLVKELTATGSLYESFEMIYVPHIKSIWQEMQVETEGCYKSGREENVGPKGWNSKADTRRKTNSSFCPASETSLLADLLFEFSCVFEGSFPWYRPLLLEGTPTWILLPSGHLHCLAILLYKR